MTRIKFALIAGTMFLAACTSTASKQVVRVDPAGPARFNFVEQFAIGKINSDVAAATPTGKGAVVLEWPNADVKTKSLTVLATYRYAFQNVAVHPGDRLEFIAAKPYSIGDRVHAFVDVVDAGVTKRVVDDVLPLAVNNVPIWKAFSVSLDGYANKNVTVVFGADSLPTDGRAAWVAFGDAQIDGPK